MGSSGKSQHILQFHPACNTSKKPPSLRMLCLARRRHIQFSLYYARSVKAVISLSSSYVKKCQSVVLHAHCAHLHHAHQDGQPAVRRPALACSLSGGASNPASASPLIMLCFAASSRGQSLDLATTGDTVAWELLAMPAVGGCSAGGSSAPAQAQHLLAVTTITRATIVSDMCGSRSNSQWLSQSNKPTDVCHAHNLLWTCPAAQLHFSNQLHKQGALRTSC